MFANAVLAEPSVHKEPVWTVDLVVRLIKVKESRGNEHRLYPHPDGVSKGPWGLVEKYARRALVDAKLRTNMIVYTASIEDEQERDCRDFLQLQTNLWKHLADAPTNMLQAAGFYHGGDARERKDYCLALRRIYESGNY